MRLKEIKFAGLLSVLLGILFIILKQDVITISMCIIGALFIAAAIYDLVKKAYPFAIIKGVIGPSIIVFCWLFINLALFILAAIIIAFGLLQIVGIEAIADLCGTKQKIFIYAKPVIYILAGLCLLLNQWATMGFAFIFIGILLIISGIILLFEKR